MLDLVAWLFLIIAFAWGLWGIWYTATWLLGGDD